MNAPTKPVKVADDTENIGRIGSADPATQATPGAAKASPPSGECPLRDWRGRFGVLTCTNGHDRCFYGPTLDCPYCEVRSGKGDSA